MPRAVERISSRIDTRQRFAHQKLRAPPTRDRRATLAAERGDQGDVDGRQCQRGYRGHVVAVARCTTLALDPAARVILFVANSATALSSQFGRAI